MNYGWAQSKKKYKLLFCLFSCITHAHYTNTSTPAALLRIWLDLVTLSKMLFVTAAIIAGNNILYKCSNYTTVYDVSICLGLQFIIIIYYPTPYCHTPYCRNVYYNHLSYFVHYVLISHCKYWTCDYNTYRLHIIILYIRVCTYVVVPRLGIIIDSWGSLKYWQWSDHHNWQKTRINPHACLDRGNSRSVLVEDYQRW